MYSLPASWTGPYRYAKVSNPSFSTTRLRLTRRVTPPAMVHVRKGLGFEELGENVMPISVFLIEDMKPLRSALAELLVNRGDFAIVGTADTEAEANLWFEEHVGKWDLTIVDLILEQGTGMGVISKAREQSADGRIVV